VPDKATLKPYRTPRQDHDPQCRKQGLDPPLSYRVPRMAKECKLNEISAEVV